MKLEQISVFLENKAGRLAEVTGTLADAGVNIKALALADTSEFGILRLIVGDHEKAKDVLKAKGFTVTRTHVVAVEVEHTAGGLHKILTILEGKGINVEYMYGFPYRADGAIMVFRFDRTEQAIEVLQQSNIKIFSGEDVCM